MEILGSLFFIFIKGYCKVEFLCYEGWPNWLGWALLGIGIFLILKIIENKISRD